MHPARCHLAAAAGLGSRRAGRRHWRGDWASDEPRGTAPSRCVGKGLRLGAPGRAGGAGGRAGSGRRAGRAAARLPPPARPSAAPFCRRLPRGPEAAAGTAARAAGREPSELQAGESRAAAPHSGSAPAPAGGPGLPPSPRGRAARPPCAVTHPRRGLRPHAGSRGPVAPAAASGRASRALAAALPGAPVTAAAGSGVLRGEPCAPPQVGRPASLRPGTQGQREGRGLVRFPVWLPLLFAEATPSNFKCRCTDLATFPTGLPLGGPGHPVASALDGEIDIGVR